MSSKSTVSSFPTSKLTPAAESQQQNTPVQETLPTPNLGLFNTNTIIDDNVSLSELGELHETFLNIDSCDNNNTNMSTYVKPTSNK